MKTVIAVVFVSVASSCFTCNVCRAVTYTATLLHPPNYESSQATGADLQQVGFAVVAGTAGTQHALMWNDTVSSKLDLHPANYEYSVATGIFGNRQVGYAWGDTIPVHAQLWSGTSASAVDLHPDNYAGSQALGISADSQVGYGYITKVADNIIASYGPYAILWHNTAASAIALHPAGFDYSEAVATWGDSQVGNGVTIEGTVATHHALMWHGSPESVVDLNGPGLLSGWATGVFDDTQVGYGYGDIGGSYFSPHALLWHGTPESQVDLHPQGARLDGTRALAVSGTTQVGYSDSFFQGRHAVLWHGTAASFTDLHPLLSALIPSLENSYATGVAPNGNVVGYAEDTSGKQYAVMWTPVPEPTSCALLVGSFIFGSSVFGRRRPLTQTPAPVF